MSKPNVKIFDSKSDLIDSSVQMIVDLACQKVDENGRFTIVLSGGSTPKPIYEKLASEPYINRMPWEQTFFFFGDERCVPHDSPESNYGMADKAMFSKALIPDENIFATQDQDKDPESSAAQYEQTIRKFFKTEKGKFPSFDLMLLGMGPDGHTASLFPGSEGLNERQSLVVANYVEKFQAYRITMTFPLIDNADNIVFLVAGSDKAQVLSEILCSDKKDSYPAQLVKPQAGTLKWYLDREAAAKLDPALCCS